mgnify:CR=1 FL=1
MNRVIFFLSMFFAALAIHAQAPSAVVAVDLGLPSGTKWANMNVGAKQPENYGELYAFGELEPKANYVCATLLGYSGYEWKHYAPYLASSGFSGSAYDVAHVKWGGKWRMPTIDELNELISKCKRETSGGSFKFTGPNGQSILLPRASKGYWTATPKRDDPLHNGGYVYYGGSSYCYNFSTTATLTSWEDGLYVRPVLNESTSVSDVPMIEMDEDVDFVPADTTKVVVKLTKTLRQGWNTLVLPFMPGIQLSNVLFDKVKLYAFKGFENGILKFATVSNFATISANVPYLVYYSGQSEKFTKYFSHHNYKGTGGADLTIRNGVPIVTQDNCSFIGTYASQIERNGNFAENDYILDGRTFRKTEDGDTLRGFSAYMKMELPDGFDETSPLPISIDGVLLSPRLILDECATDYPASEACVDVQVNKTFKANQWNTVCLPFSMTSEQLKTVFGADVLLAKFTQWNSTIKENGDTLISFIFDKNITDLKAGSPYMIRTSKNISSFMLDRVSINTSTSPVVRLLDEKRRNFIAFYGTYVSVPIWRNLYVKDGKFCMAMDDGETMVNAYGGYFGLYHEDGEWSENTQFVMSLTDALEGDVDGNCVVDIVDVTMTVSHILGQTPDGFDEKAADVDGNGMVDIVDVTSIIDMILKME